MYDFVQEDHTTKQMLEQFVDLAGKKVHVEKRSLVGPQIEAFAAAVRQDDVHVLAVSVSAHNMCPLCIKVMKLYSSTMLSQPIRTLLTPSHSMHFIQHFQ